LKQTKKKIFFLKKWTSPFNAKLPIEKKSMSCLIWKTIGVYATYDIPNTDPMKLNAIMVTAE